jgi:hypothetical protein
MTDLNDIEFNESENTDTLAEQETITDEPVLTFYKYDTDGFYLGTTSNCQTFETTRFVTHPYNTNGTLNESITDNLLRPLIVEDPMDNVNALAVAVNTAFILNAFNERLKVRVTYHRLGNVYDVNSVRLQGIAKIP